MLETSLSSKDTFEKSTNPLTAGFFAAAAGAFADLRADSTSYTMMRLLGPEP
jgi:hypothetical protein